MACALMIASSLLGGMMNVFWPAKKPNKVILFLTIGLMLQAVICSCYMFWDVAILHNSYNFMLCNWINIEGFQVDWLLKIDTLSAYMMLIVNCISCLVHLYSLGYMQHEPDLHRFMGWLSLFTFAMIALVSAGNMAVLFLGWECVGLSSYVLIGFWRHKPAANDASIKAFVVNRVADVGLVLAMGLMFTVYGSLDLDVVFANLHTIANLSYSFFGMDIAAVEVLVLFLVIAAMGKSAQLGLHIWLPDAMEGPTPVSALIHAATMVTAGIYLLCRMSPIIEMTTFSKELITVVGCVTAFVLGSIAFNVYDVKKIIAYSTGSQSGLMFLTIGVGSYDAAMFHLLTHAVFKSLLFLSAGSLIHACDGEQDLRKMGGLWRKIPVTYCATLISVLGLSGFPFLAGYYSKEAIFNAIYNSSSYMMSVALVMGLLVSFMTSLYAFRLLIMAFHGKENNHYKAHESGWKMLLPMAILSVLTIIVGKSAEHLGWFGRNGHNFWQNALITGNMTGLATPWWLIVSTKLCALAGLVTAYVVFSKKPQSFLLAPASIKLAFSNTQRFLHNGWYINCLLAKMLPVKFFNLSTWLYRIDKQCIDRYGPLFLMRVIQKSSRFIGQSSTGYIFDYALSIICGAIILVLLCWARSGR